MEIRIAALHHGNKIVSWCSSESGLVQLLLVIFQQLPAQARNQGGWATVSRKRSPKPKTMVDHPKHHVSNTC